MNSSKNKYSSNDKKPGKTKAFFICVLIASFLWLVHSLNRVYTYTIKIPVTFKNIPVNKRPLLQIPEFIQVEVKASGLKLAFILMNKSEQGFEIDFNHLKAVNKDQNYILSSSDLQLNKRFKFETQIKSVSPDTLYFTEKTGFQKIVPIKVPTYIKCKEGYGFTKPVISPVFITIWGDTNFIEKIDTLYTQSLSLSNLSQNVNTNLHLIKPSSDIHTTVNEVNVLIEVSKLVQQTITIPVVNQRNYPNQQIRIYPSKVNVKFTSIQNSFHSQDTSFFKAMINTEKVNPATNKCPVFLSTVPGHVTVLEIEPKQVEILILKK